LLPCQAGTSKWMLSGLILVAKGARCQGLARLPAACLSVAKLRRCHAFQREPKMICSWSFVQVRTVVETDFLLNPAHHARTHVITSSRMHVIAHVITHARISRRLQILRTSSSLA
jgi:hypothetical protein